LVKVDDSPLNPYHGDGFMLMTIRRLPWPPLLLFLIALSLRLITAALTDFDGLYGQDPFAYYGYALELRTALADFQPPPPFFWPIGYPLLIVFASLLTGVQPLAGQLVSMVGGALIAPMVYLLAREVRPSARFGPFIAGLLAATAAQLMISSLSIMSDAAGLAWVTFSAWAMVRYLRRLELRWLALAAFALGWAVLCRWALALAVFPWAISALVAWYMAALPLRRIILAIATAVLVGGLILGSQFIFSLGEEELPHTGDLQVVGWNAANAFKSTLSNSDGVFYYERPTGIYYALPAAHPAFVFPFFAPFLLFAFVSLVVGEERLKSLQRTGRSWLAARAQSLGREPGMVLLVVWPLMVYLFLVGIAWQNPRFSLALFPPLLVLVGLGIEWVWQQVGRKWRPFFVVWCALGLLGSLVWMGRDVRNFTGVKDANVAAVQWAEAQTEPGATAVTFGVTLIMNHYTSLNGLDIYTLNENDLAALLAEDSPFYLLLDVANVEQQWQGKSPQLNYQWLQEQAEVVEIGRFNHYTLFEVERRLEIGD
jgi:4-amino-4-deoxy-L-arabinose transferase-like glycosyltransferase